MSAAMAVPRRPRVPQEIKDAHRPALHRKRLGTSWSGRAIYGNDVSCSCGWRVNTNERAREALEWHKDHLVDVLEASR